MPRRSLPQGHGGATVQPAEQETQAEEVHTDEPGSLTTDLVTDSNSGTNGLAALVPASLSLCLPVSLPLLPAALSLRQRRLWGRSDRCQHRIDRGGGNGEQGPSRTAPKQASCFYTTTTTPPPPLSPFPLFSLFSEPLPLRQGVGSPVLSFVVLFQSRGQSGALGLHFPALLLENEF